MKKIVPKIYLGVDWGIKKIGLAAGDDFTRVAVPLTVVNTAAELLAIIRREKIGHVVVGEPRGLRGEAPGPEFTAFVDKLRQTVKLPVDLVDERLSTRLAARLTRETKNSGRSDDDLAAMLILQSYFDARESLKK